MRVIVVTKTAKLRLLRLSFPLLCTYLLSARVEAQLIAVNFDQYNSKVFSIDEATGETTFIGDSGVGRINSLAVNSFGELFSAGSSEGGEFRPTDQLVKIDPEDGTATSVAILTGFHDPDIRALAFSPHNVLFGIQSASGISCDEDAVDTLVRIDVNTGEIMTVGNLPDGFQSLEFGIDGKMYGWHGPNSCLHTNGMGLVTIDPETTIFTDVDRTVPGSRHMQSIAFSPSGALFGFGSGQLKRISVNTGRESEVSGIGEDISGMVFLPKRSCDFNADGSCHVFDIDELIRAAQINDVTFDLNFDGAVDDYDRDEWLARAAIANGVGTPYLVADANLDGSVDASDLNVLGLHWQQRDRVWSQGNFVIDEFGEVNASDLTSLALNWQASIPQTSAPVPEPAGLLLLGIAIVVGYLNSISRSNFKF